MREAVRANVERANWLLERAGSDERVDVDAHVALLDRVAPAIVPLLGDTVQLVHQSIAARERVLLEGAQGAMLDVDHGTYPFVTSSSTISGGAAVGAGVGPRAIDAVLGVVKAYATRVGNGPFPTEAPEAVAGRLRELGGEYGATTGRPRRCGWFDAVAARYSAMVNGMTHVAVTKLDVLDAFASIPVCVGYRLDGEALDGIPADAETMERIEPVYEELDGWAQPTVDARCPGDLPEAARAYLQRMGELLGVEVAYVSVGTRRDQIIKAA
jgi:adenylosuccinate synthase